MSTIINTNTTAMMASNNLSNNSSALSGDIEQLSSGLRINSAADDPAGLVISEDMKGQINGIEQATSNTNDAINVTKTAEGALNEVQSLLMDMRQKAVAASNAGVNSSADVAADQAEIAAAIASINNISTTTQFDGKNLLDGSASSSPTVTAGSATSSGGDLTVLSQGRWASGSNYIYNANTVTGPTTTTATSTASAALTTANYGGTIAINGTTYNVGSDVSLTQLNAAITASGYTATVTGTSFKLTSTATGAPASTQSVDLAGLTAGAAGTGDTFGAPVIAPGTSGAMTLSDGTHTLTSVQTISNGASGNTYIFNNGLVVSSADGTGAVTAQLTTVAGTSPTGTALQFQIGANAGQTTAVDIPSTAASQLGMNAGTYTDANGVTQSVYTDSIADLNVTTFKGAQDAIKVIDKAITDVSTIRANLGAYQTETLQANANSLAVADQNLTASNSTITDTNLASTIVNYTRDQILVQSATTALSYANQMPQAILKLLQ